ncbi:MAG TPA: GxxExxY protein, partial [Chthoniobacteraceae bacterium]
MEKEQLEQLAAQIVDAAIEVHRELGPGLLESAYEVALCRELSLRNIGFERQKPKPVRYKGTALDCGYRIDLLVEGAIIIELKAVEELSALHEAQLLTYLKLTGCSIGFLLNFNTRLLKHGLKRLVHGLEEPAGRSPSSSSFPSRPSRLR